MISNECQRYTAWNFDTVGFGDPKIYTTFDAGDLHTTFDAGDLPMCLIKKENSLLSFCCLAGQYSSVVHLRHKKYDHSTFLELKKYVTNIISHRA